MTTLLIPGRTPEGKAVADESPDHLDPCYAAAVVAITDTLARLEGLRERCAPEFLLDSTEVQKTLRQIHNDLRDDLESLILNEPRAILAQGCIR